MTGKTPARQPLGKQLGRQPGKQPGNPLVRQRPSSAARGSAVGSDRVAGGALFLAGAALTWQSLLLPLGTLRDPGAAYLPLALSLLLAVFGATLTAWPGHGPSLAALAWGDARHALGILGACGASALLLERLGYRMTSFLLLAVLLGAVARRRWWVTLLVAAGLSWGTWFVFADVLKVPLPPGPFGF